jgi:hypothetical protein
VTRRTGFDASIFFNSKRTGATGVSALTCRPTAVGLSAAQLPGDDTPSKETSYSPSRIFSNEKTPSASLVVYFPEGCNSRRTFSRQLGSVALTTPAIDPNLYTFISTNADRPAWTSTVPSDAGPGSYRLIGMLGAPLLPAVQYHLGIHRVGLNLAPVVIGPAMPLALWLAANALLESVRGWMKASLAVRTAD